MTSSRTALCVAVAACCCLASPSHAFGSSSKPRPRSITLRQATADDHFDTNTAKNIAPARTHRRRRRLPSRVRPPSPSSLTKLHLSSSFVTEEETKQTSMKPPPKSKTPQKKAYSPVFADATVYQRNEMLNHDILSKEQELELGLLVQTSVQLREQMKELLEEKQALEMTDTLLTDNLSLEYSHSDEALFLAQQQGQLYRNDDDIITEDVYELSTLSEYNLEQETHDWTELDDLDWKEVSLEHYAMTQQAQLRSTVTASSFDDDLLLTENDIIHKLGIVGGRTELRRILLEGAFAREQLIRHNIRLVVSIAKRWARHSAKYASEDTSRLVNIYAGSSSRPSLDEAIQEGILGLARAADRYDPSRGLRFATYSTHWVTSFVRNCFQQATTGCLHVPAQLHEVKSRYKRVLKEYYENQQDIPEEAVLAQEVGVSVKRLRTALQVTRSLVSIDGPSIVGAGPQKGSGAGGESMGDAELLLSDTLPCKEARAEDQVELSFLRQCLENAMAAELSPHERDVLRLRLGLDDGVTRSIKEVVDVCGGNISASQVRSAEQRAYKKLRSPYSVANYKLLAYLDFANVDYASMKFGI